MKIERDIAGQRKSTAIFLAFGLTAAMGAVLALPNAVVAYDPGKPAQVSPAPVQLAGADAIVVQLTDSLKFAPATLKIKVGETVEWRNDGSVRHTVTLDPAKAGNAQNVMLPEGAKTFDSGWVDDGKSFRYTFTKAGVYRYVCLPHETAEMIGEIVVE